MTGHNMASEDKKFVRPLDFSAGNLAAAWKVFKDQFSIYNVVKKLGGMTVDEQIGHMLMCMGSDAVPIYSQFTFSTTDENRKKKLANVIKMFDLQIGFKRQLFSILVFMTKNKFAIKVLL